jgi:hypothetical protein
MWNPEARDFSPIIFTFMSSLERPKMPPLPGRRGTRRSLWKRAAAGLDELELEPWVSLWSNHFGEESTPPLAWTEGNKMPPLCCLEGGEQGVPERSNPLRRRSSLWYSEKRLRKNRNIRGFCSSPNKLNGKPDSRHNAKNIHEDTPTSILFYFASGVYS